jgi:hypothetical protein
MPILGSLPSVSDLVQRRITTRGLGKGKSMASEVAAVLAAHRQEIWVKGVCRPMKEGLYRAVLKASLVRIYEYAEFVHGDISDEKADGFFAAAPLRQCCEDLIALKFLALLKRSDRDSVIRALMLITTNNAAEKQVAFFKKSHPHQFILPPPWEKHAIGKVKDKLTEIGARTLLWRNERKLPPIEQMAMKVGLTPLYEFLYAATSEIVHFNVRIALRSGWGDLSKLEFRFSPANFSRYYILFARTYSAFLLVQFCRAFRTMLKLSPSFMDAIDEIELSIELSIESQLRWPEILTFEEMNIQHNENIILQAAFAVMQEERVQTLRKKHEQRRKRR